MHLLEKIIHMAKSGQHTPSLQLSREQARVSNTKKEKSSAIWVTIYEFLDEILGSIIPGMFYSLLLFIPAYMMDFFGDSDSGKWLMAASFFVVSYAIGTAFRRSNIKIPDEKSAKHIYYRNIDEENGFTFYDSLRYKEILELLELADTEVACGKIRFQLSRSQKRKLEKIKERKEKHKEKKRPIRPNTLKKIAITNAKYFGENPHYAVLEKKMLGA